MNNVPKKQDMTGQLGNLGGGTDPIHNKAHQIGSKSSPADDAPEFHAKTLPPGSAPSDRTFTPNATSEIPSQADNANVLRSHGKESTQTKASDTLGGSTSADVHAGLGKPIQGQSSSELRHDGRSHRDGQRGGLHGVGASGAEGMSQLADPTEDAEQRALDKEEAPSGHRGDKGVAGAQETPSVSAGEVAAERD